MGFQAATLHPWLPWQRGAHCTLHPSEPAELSTALSRSGRGRAQLGPKQGVESSSNPAASLRADRGASLGPRHRARAKPAETHMVPFAGAPWPPPLAAGPSCPRRVAPPPCSHPTTSKPNETQQQLKSALSPSHPGLTHARRHCFLLDLLFAVALRGHSCCCPRKGLQQRGTQEP